MFITKTIDTIVKDFQRAIDALESVAADHTVKAQSAAEPAEVLKSTAEYHTGESNRAWSIKAKIEALLK